jgi:hypothetical protein
MAKLDGKVKWKAGAISKPSEINVRAKVIIFLIDRTWTPILEVAIQAILAIFTEHVGNADTVGLYSLGESWLVRPTLKGGNENKLAEDFKNAERVSGKCMLYRSMRETLETLITTRRNENLNRWLVVLTDLVDLEKMDLFTSQAVSLSQYMQNQSTGKYTVAVIDSSSISGWEPEHKRWPMFRSNMEAYMGALKKGGKVGHHLVAGNLDELSQKFQEVAELMAEDLAEDL